MAAKKRSEPPMVQAGFSFDVQYVPKEARETNVETKPQESKVRPTITDHTTDWKNFGNYIKNVRGNKLL